MRRELANGICLSAILARDELSGAKDVHKEQAGVCPSRPAQSSASISRLLSREKTRAVFEVVLQDRQARFCCNLQR